MRLVVGLLLLSLAVAAVHGQGTGDAVPRLSTADQAGAETFVEGKKEGVCVCGQGIRTPECTDAVKSFCATNKGKVCSNIETFSNPNATINARLDSGKFLADYLQTDCAFKFPKNTSGCDCAEDPDSEKCRQAAWEACRRKNTMCPAMHYAEGGGPDSVTSFANFIEAKCGGALATTNMTMKYEDTEMPYWQNQVKGGTLSSLSNITGLPAYMIRGTAEQVVEDNEEPIAGRRHHRKMLNAQGWVQKQVTKVVVKYAMRSLVKKQAGVLSSLTGASRNNGAGFMNSFHSYGVPTSVTPFMAINSGPSFGGPLWNSAAAPAPAPTTSSTPTDSGKKSGLTAGQIAGIVIGSVLGFLLLCCLPLLCCLCKKKKKDKKVKEVETHHVVKTHDNMEKGHHTTTTMHPEPVKVDDVHVRDARDKHSGLGTAAGVGAAAAAAGVGAAALAHKGKDKDDKDRDHTRLDTVDPKDTGTPVVSPDGTMGPTPDVDGSGKGVNKGALAAGAAGAGLLGAGAAAAATKGKKDDSDSSDDDDDTERPMGLSMLGAGGSRHHKKPAKTKSGGSSGGGLLAGLGLGGGAAAAAAAAHDSADEKEKAAAAAGGPVNPVEQSSTVRDPYAAKDVPVRDDGEPTETIDPATGMPVKKTPTVYERVVDAVQTVKGKSKPT